MDSAHNLANSAPQQLPINLNSAVLSSKVSDEQNHILQDGYDYYISQVACLSDEAEQVTSNGDMVTKESHQENSSLPNDQANKDEKVFACTYCDQTFSQVSNLKKHQRIHTREKPHVCSQCDRAFTTLSNLKQHMQIHEKIVNQHNERYFLTLIFQCPKEQRVRYECGICNKTYFYQSSLNKHMKSHDKSNTTGTDEDCSENESPKRKNSKAIRDKSFHSDASLSQYDEELSDISPTIKKVKKEAVSFEQATPNINTEAPSATSFDFCPTDKIEEELIARYNQNLVKLLSQPDDFSENSTLMAILGLNIFRITDFQAVLPTDSNLSKLKGQTELTADFYSEPQLISEDYCTPCEGEEQHEDQGHYYCAETEIAATYGVFQPSYTSLQQENFNARLPNGQSGYSQDFSQDAFKPKPSSFALEKTYSISTNESYFSANNQTIELIPYTQQQNGDTNEMIGHYDNEMLCDNEGFKRSGVNPDSWFSFELPREDQEFYARSYVENPQFNYLH